ncbi:uncharacterized protein E0L32_005542 [Thyridium curvatum]|uniref:HNH nuclease domain-containing protein n=1 Tax=Thyridium curvatum TaxID=1093900 RepID=A0A507B5H4_9PEZI|nr:uncharacterized protein E0L32_005542 [Thyridium curvatum]TPX14346.1 hypothetical protein E0L32_005542 [Thyridium curvatum]
MEPRPPSTRPIDLLAGREDIQFLHPGYPHPTNLLLKLPRLDQAEPTEFGVHHATALLACQLIAANQFTGYLIDEHQEPVTQDVVVLLGRKYFFVVNGDDQYPVVPSFNDWQFPHDNQPSWPPIPSTPIATDACCITANLHALEKAYIIPREAQPWYSENGMMAYSTTVLGIDDPDNLLPMRSDIHCIFDDRWFVIVPKHNDYRVYCIDRRAGALDIHNIPLQGLRGNIRPLLLARFAWAILLQVKLFITLGHTRKVKIFNHSDCKWETLEMSGVDLRARYSGGGSKASSPAATRSKRPYQATTMDRDDWDRDDWDTVSNERRIQNWIGETAVEQELEASVSELVRGVYPVEKTRLASDSRIIID